MSDEPLAREGEPIERVRARLEALAMANAAPRCGARSKRTGKPCRAAAMPNERCSIQAYRQALPSSSHAERPVQGSRRQEYWAADAGGPRAEQAGKVEARLLLSRSEGGTVARAGGNAYGPLSARLDLKAPRDPAVGYGPHRTIYLTGIDASGKVAEGFRAQAVQGPELTRRGHTGRLTSGQGWPWIPTTPIDTREAIGTRL